MDEADISQERLEREQALRDRARSDQPYQPPAGDAGECDHCGVWCRRLIKGACARCRDKLGLP